MIKMSSLDKEYQSLKKEINSAIQSVLHAGQYIGGQSVLEFESKLALYLNSPHVISCGNGTDALMLALMALELNPGDGVMMPAFGYISAFEMCLLLGLKPILVDINPDHFNIDENNIEEKITPNVKAIVVQHLFGQGAHMEGILAIAKKHKLDIIEDSAQAIGTKIKIGDDWKKAGTIGHIGCFSFFPNKNLGCYGDGGAICTDDPNLAEKLRMLARHGQKIKYHHDIVGINSRLDALQAALLNVKLPYLDKWNQQRTETAMEYHEALADLDGIQLPHLAQWSTHTFHQYTIKFKAEKRSTIQSELKSCGVESIVYYPKPIHHQKIYSNSENVNFSNSEQVAETVLSIPVHPYLTKMEKAKITESIKQIL